MRPRIRSIKPEFFHDEALQETESTTGLPVRLAYIGLWCMADREGRFEWRPKALKASILPFDDIDFSRVLDALTTRGWLVKYASQGREYGWIRNFQRHQSVNNREVPSEIPAPPQDVANTDTSTRAPHDPDASTSRDGRVPSPILPYPILPYPNGAEPIHASAAKLTEGLPEAHRQAVQTAMRETKRPEALLAEIKALVSGMHPPAMPLAVVAQAIHEIHVTEGKVSAVSIRAFARRIVRGDPPPKPRPGENPFAAILREAQAEEAASAK